MKEYTNSWDRKKANRFNSFIHGVCYSEVIIFQALNRFEITACWSISFKVIMSKIMSSFEIYGLIFFDKANRQVKNVIATVSPKTPFQTRLLKKLKSYVGTSVPSENALFLNYERVRQLFNNTYKFTTFVNLISFHFVLLLE